MSGACVQGDHSECPDSIDDTGTCSCPCHLIGDTVDVVLGGDDDV